MRGTHVIYFKSLNRYFNVLGVDRQLFFLFVGLSLPIALSARLNLAMDCIAITVFFTLYSMGVLMTRADNQILQIYRRHIHYKKYYAANPSVHSNIILVKPSVPFYQGKGELV